MDELPACKDLRKRCRADASGLLACQQMLNTKGLCHETLALGEPLIDERPSAALRLELSASLTYQLENAKT